jgi:hypothetical protein
MHWTDADFIPDPTRPGLYRFKTTVTAAERPGLQAMTPAVPALPATSLRSPYRSKTEARYADVLRWRQAEQQISAWWYEPFSLRLGANCHYRPDFLVALHGTSRLALVEVKGAWIRDRAMDKPRAAATRYPCFVFVLAQWDRHRWTENLILAHGASQ